MTHVRWHSQEANAQNYPSSETSAIYLDATFLPHRLPLIEGATWTLAKASVAGTSLRAWPQRGFEPGILTYCPFLSLIMASVPTNSDRLTGFVRSIWHSQVVTILQLGRSMVTHTAHRSLDLIHIDYSVQFIRFLNTYCLGIIPTRPIRAVTFFLSTTCSCNLQNVGCCIHLPFSIFLLCSPLRPVSLRLHDFRSFLRGCCH